MLERAKEIPNISLKTPYVPEEFVAGDDGEIAKVRLRHAETGEVEDLEVGGAFVAIGHTPFGARSRPGRDRRAGLRAHPGRLHPHQPRPASPRSATWWTTLPAVTAAGTGCMGALDAEWYLRDTPPSPEAHWAGRSGEEAMGLTGICDIGRVALTFRCRV